MISILKGLQKSSEAMVFKGFLTCLTTRKLLGRGEPPRSHAPGHRGRTCEPFCRLKGHLKFNRVSDIKTLLGEKSDTELPPSKIKGPNKRVLSGKDQKCCHLDVGRGHCTSHLRGCHPPRWHWAMKGLPSLSMTCRCQWFSQKELTLKSTEKRQSSCFSHFRYQRLPCGENCQTLDPSPVTRIFLQVSKCPKAFVARA